MAIKLENKIGVNYVEIAGEVLLELLEGASLHASKDKGLRALNSVQIEGSGGDLVVRATDRYRLIEGSARYLDGKIEPSLIALDDVKKIITLVKSHKSNLINIARIGDGLTVSALGNAITVTLLDANYPDFTDILSKSAGDGEASSITFNPAFMADYAKIAGKNQPVTLEWSGEQKPLRVKIAHNTIDWKALVMPMRVRA
jgi:DNA polymerase III sliding clamp (beta) subunit (PCNA family)